MDKKSSSSWRPLFTYSIVVVLSLLLFLYAGPSQSPSLKAQVLLARAVDHDNVVKNLTKRDDDYEKAVTKGNGLHCSLAKTLQDPPPMEAPLYLQTPGQAYVEGWEDFDFNGPKVGPKLSAALAAIKVPVNTLTDISWYHGEEAKIKSDPNNDDSELIDSKPSEAFFISSFSPSGGVIIADNNWSVDAAIKEQGLVEAEITTHVRRWSDAAWMQWVKACNDADFDDVSNVKYIFRATVVNPSSLDLLFQALREKYSDSPTVPPIGVWNNRLTLDVVQNPRQFYAVLGSPNGSGVAYLLRTHKGPLGVKTVNRVDIFTGNNPFTIPNDGIGGAEGAGISLLFYVTAP
ncbi:hypothetical protein THAR02_05302 [Trichoderma harzianum]|uniref:Uncharacterized protein n=1 Tax=Trichoderma harzianum TaxID=5544 RepID=A0A0G0ACB0_TRIHA|nr:hypothetical protein THAR02_05302 [Trichoderma harzianum]